MIREAGQGDIPRLAELWARAFPGERTVAQRIAHLETGGVYGGIETAWLAETGGRLTGAFRAYALTQHMHGAELPTMGLAAVAVDETARRRGLGQELCRHAVQAGRERGDVLSVLYPFSPHYYETLGWGTVGELHAYRFRPESLLPSGGLDVRRASGDDTAAIAACYGEAARAGNGLIRRTSRVWRHHLEGDVVQVYLAGEQRVDAYAIVRFGRAASPEDRPMYIRELVARTNEAHDALLGWVRAQQDAWRLVVYEAMPDEHFAHRLMDPRPPGFQSVRYLWAPTARVIRGPMLRMLDVRRALQGRHRWGPAGSPMQFGLELLDPIVPENAGPFVVEFDGRNVAVREGSAMPLLRMPVSVLARLYAGELGVLDALRLGLAEEEGDASGVDALFRTRSRFRLLDEF
jgi:predicted acetyltransferase